MGNLEYSFDNILKSYIDTGKQLTDHQVNLISSNKNMAKTYIRKRAIALKKTGFKDTILSDKESELLKKYDKKIYDDYMNYISNLKELDLRYNYNKLTTISEGIGNLTNLKELNLSFNLLRGLPDSIGNLTNLMLFWVYDNNLTTLPESIGNLTKLKELVLDNNKLTTLPESIGNLTKLKELVLDNNKLTTLPESIGNLTNLSYLDLHNNELISLPNSIVKLINLNDLWLQDNPISDEEKEKIKKLLPNTKIYF